ncbi:MAG: PsiF family protein [Xanthobacteraceae bacterium]
MLRYASIAALLIAMLPSAPCFALTAKEKMVTCKFGADDQKLQGAPRAKFLKNCMANRNDPRGAAAGATAGAAPTPGAPPPPKQ